MNSFSDFEGFDLDLPGALNHAPKIEGTWQRISIEPNPITGERYNIGVLFTCQGQRYTQLIQDPYRLKCLFDQQTVNNILFSVKHIAELVNHQTLTPDEFLLSDPMPASGGSVDEIIQRLYGQAVTLGRPARSQQDETVKAKVSKTQLVLDVYDYLKRTRCIQASGIIPQHRELTIDGEGHTVDVPLVSSNQAADIISATYHRKNDIDRIVSQSAVDLRAVKAYKQRFEKTGLFLLRPTQDMGFSKREVQQAELAIDQILWKIKQDFHISVEDSAEALAESAAHWFKLTA